GRLLLSAPRTGPYGPNSGIRLVLSLSLRDVGRHAAPPGWWRTGGEHSGINSGTFRSALRGGPQEGEPQRSKPQGGGPHRGGPQTAHAVYLRDCLRGAPCPGFYAQSPRYYGPSPYYAPSPRYYGPSPYYASPRRYYGPPF